MALQVPSIASQLEIKGAYKARALECHPDKHSESPEATKAAEATFKLLGEALEVLERAAGKPAEGDNRSDATSRHPARACR